MPKFSVLIPVFNEDESLEILFFEIKREMESLGPKDPYADFYEVIFVNDGSNDQSLNKMTALKNNFPHVVRIVDLERRGGQTHTLKVGLEAAKGEMIVTLDADLQNDPADIPKLVEKIKEGYDVVCGWRKVRMDSPLKMFLSKLGNVLQRLISGLKIHDVSCTLRLYRRECLPKLSLEWEGQHRFIPLILSLQGCKVGEVVSNHRQRRYSYSKYSHKRIFKVVLDFFRVLLTR